MNLVPIATILPAKESTAKGPGAESSTRNRKAPGINMPNQPASEKTPRRVQGRPESPWNKGLSLFAPYDQFAIRQRDFALRSDQRAFRSPFGNLRCTPFEGHCSETFKFQCRSTRIGEDAPKESRGRSLRPVTGKPSGIKVLARLFHATSLSLCEKIFTSFKGALRSPP